MTKFIGRTPQTPLPNANRGVAAVEFALILVLLMTIVAFIVEGGRALWYYDALAKATRDAARFMSVVPAAELRDSRSAARELVELTAGLARVPDVDKGSGVVTVTCQGAVASDCSGLGEDDAAKVSSVTVAVAYPLLVGEWIPFITIGPEPFSPFSITLRPATTMPYMW